jgi:TRAP-type uncharacterized transport system substrate-binding protein
MFRVPSADDFAHPSPHATTASRCRRPVWRGWLAALVLGLGAAAFAGTLTVTPLAAKSIAAKKVSAKKAGKERVVSQLRRREPALQSTASGAADSRTLDDAASSDQMKELLNANTVTLMSGCCVTGAYTAFGADLKDMMAALEDPSELRVLPILGGGAGSNVRDLLYLRSVDMAILNTDSLEYYEGKPLYHDLKQRIHYITKLFNEEVHVFAGDKVGSLQDLGGKRVGFVSSSAQVTGSLLFKKLGIVPQETIEVSEADGAAMLRDGSLDAMIRVTGKPLQNVGYLKQIFPGIRLVPILFDPALIETYLPTQFGHDDYPELIRDGEEVPSVATRTILAVFNWPAASDRYRRLARFTNLLFDHFDDMRRSKNLHSKWAEVTLSADVPGMTRFKPAADKLAATNKVMAAAKEEDLMSDFKSFLASDRAAKVRSGAGSDSEQLFREFIKWQKEQR